MAQHSADFQRGDSMHVDEAIAGAHADHAVSLVRYAVAQYDAGQYTRGELLAAIHAAGNDALRACLRGWAFLEEKVS